MDPTDTVGQTASDTPVQPRRGRGKAVFPLRRRPRREKRLDKSNSKFTGIRLDVVLIRRLKRVKAAVEFATGEAYAQADLMDRVITYGLERIEDELRIDSAGDFPTPRQNDEPTKEGIGSEVVR